MLRLARGARRRDHRDFSGDECSFEPHGLRNRAAGIVSSYFATCARKDLTHLGQYHSHLATENVPSPTDIEQAGYPDQAYFIVSPRPDAPNPVRAFSIRDGEVQRT